MAELRLCFCRRTLATHTPEEGPLLVKGGVADVADAFNAKSHAELSALHGKVRVLVKSSGDIKPGNGHHAMSRRLGDFLRSKNASTCVFDDLTESLGNGGERDGTTDLEVFAKLFKPPQWLQVAVRDGGEGGGGKEREGNVDKQ